MVVLGSRMVECMCRSDRASRDHRDDRGSGRDLGAHAAAREQRGGAFADPAPSGRQGIRHEPVLQRPRSHTESGQPAEMPDEHGRQQRGGLALEAAPQALGVRLVLVAAARAALKVRERALCKLLARGLPVL